MTVEGLPSTSAKRFETLDALRGICALIVALSHFKATGIISNLPFIRNGWLFVDYFFVLSGFVIAHSYGRRLSAKDVSVGRFMALRAGRIVPLHIAVIAAFFLLELAFVVLPDLLGPYSSREPFSGSKTLEALFQNLFLLNSFDLADTLTWNGPSWSIAAEMWTYLLFAFVFLIPRHSTAAIIALSVVAPTLIAGFWPNLSLTYDWGFIRCVLGFGIGVLTYRIWLAKGGMGSTILEIAVLAIALVFVSLAQGHVTLLAPVVFAMTILVLAPEAGKVSTLLATRPVQFLGLVSYSIYMVHTFVQSRMMEVLEITKLAPVETSAEGVSHVVADPLMGDALSLAMCLLVIAVSWVSYTLVEKRGNNIVRRYVRREG